MHFDGESAREFAGGAFERFANVSFQSLAECGLQDGAAIGVGGYQRYAEMREREDAAAARQGLNFGFDSLREWRDA